MEKTEKWHLRDEVRDYLPGKKRCQLHHGGLDPASSFFLDSRLCGNDPLGVNLVAVVIINCKSPDNLSRPEW
jgi:hypothetical protein